jgi:hypothetical protein
LIDSFKVDQTRGKNNETCLEEPQEILKNFSLINKKSFSNQQIIIYFNRKLNQFSPNNQEF